MPKVRWIFVLAGAATFLAAHAIEVAAQIGGAQPWFFSALPSALFTGAAMFVAGSVAGSRVAGPLTAAFLAGVLLAAGAAVPLMITLFIHPNGPGTLFPLAIMFGVAVLACVSVAGALAGWALRQRRTPQ